MEDVAEWVGVEELENNEITLRKRESLEDKERIGGDWDREEREEENELVEINERPERLHRWLSKSESDLQTELSRGRADEEK